MSKIDACVKLINTKPDGIGLLKITSFNRQSSKEMISAEIKPRILTPKFGPK